MSYRDMVRDAGYDPDSGQGQQLMASLEAADQDEAMRHNRLLGQEMTRLQVMAFCAYCPLETICTGLEIQCSDFTETTGVSRITLEPQT